MKILCFIDSLGPGGAQRQLVELGVGFRERGHDVSFLCYHDIPFFASRLEGAGIAITVLKERKYMRRMVRIRKFIRGHKPDAVLSFLEAPVFMATIAGFPWRRWRLVVGERRSDSSIRRSLKLIVYRWFHLFADAVVSNSSANIDHVLAVNPFLSGKKCRLIYNVVDLDWWKPSPEFVFRRFPKLKLFVGASHLPRKNAIGLLEALALLKDEEREQLSVMWYGNEFPGSNGLSCYELAVRRMKELRLERTITFKPAVTQILPVIQEADAVGLFSLSEGLPNIVCEGMACGKPVVCAAVSDIAGLLDTDTGFLCDPSDVRSIASSLRYLLSCGREKLRHTGMQNREKAMSYFRKDNIVSSYLELFKKGKTHQPGKSPVSFYEIYKKKGTLETE